MTALISDLDYAKFIDKHYIPNENDIDIIASIFNDRQLYYQYDGDKIIENLTPELFFKLISKLKFKRSNHTWRFKKFMFDPDLTDGQFQSIKHFMLDSIDDYSWVYTALHENHLHFLNFIKKYALDKYIKILSEDEFEWSLVECYDLIKIERGRLGIPNKPIKFINGMDGHIECVI